ncbi:MAG: hypothetical protein MJ002_05595 [Paludibacteraceae bacterium]|nr:hypothetical protein [Paludibacteraceae bacterium]
MNIDRLFIIDSCLRDRNRTWSLQDLIDQCGEAMKNSKRSIQGDLELMRKRFNAPIEVSDRKFYSYSDPTFNLAAQQLTEEDKATILDMIDSLRNYCRFDSVKPMLNEINKMGDKMADTLAMPRLPRPLGLAAKKPTDIRFWVDAEYVEHIVQHPIHPTMQIEQYEFDGSANFVVHTVLSAKLISWAESYKGKVILKIE